MSERKERQARKVISGQTQSSDAVGSNQWVSDRGLSLAGLALSPCSSDAQPLFPTVWPIWVCLFVGGFMLLAWVVLKEWLGRIWFIWRLGAVALVGVGLSWLGVGHALQSLEPPDVQMQLVHPTTPSVLMVNASKRVVHKPKYQIVLWNLNAPERRDPLPIPVSTGDFIRPRADWGPNQMTEIPTVKPLVKAGDHLFGFATATCPDCSGTRSYWVYIEYWWLDGRTHWRPIAQPRRTVPGDPRYLCQS